MNNKDVTIGNLPYNDFYFLVIKYAAVTKFDSKSKIPNIQVILRKVDLEKEEFLPNETDTIVYLPMNELDVVKIGSVWKKRKLVEKTWSNYNGLKYEQDLDFKFNFSMDKFEVVTYSEYINELGASLSEMYQVYIQNSEKKKLNLINKTKYTKLIDNTNKITLLLPSMELFIATYAPDHKTIRQRFLQYDVDTAVDEFIVKDESYIEDDKYYVRVRKKMDDNNVIFLAYMMFNNISRKRAKKLWMSLEYNEGDSDSGYPVRYPEVHPFHPSYLNIQVDGIWLNKNVFLVLRINNRNLPNDNEVIPINKKITVDISEVDYRTYRNEQDEKYFDEENSNDKTDDENDSDTESDENELLNNAGNEEFTLDSNKTPHTRASTQRILTEVGVIGESKPLNYINIKKIILWKNLHMKIDFQIMN